MTERKNWLKLIIVILITGILILFLFRTGSIDISDKECFNEDFHYNAISMSAIIGGFLFTGLSILISAIDKERVKRLWENNYLNNLYRSAFCGMASNLLTIASAFCLLCMSISNESGLANILIYVEISTLIFGLVFFGWCIKCLVFVIKRLNR